MPAPEPLIKFNEVCKIINGKTILNNISFNVYPKEIFGIIGSSGAGKTTLLRTFIGFYNITRGEILFNNESISRDIRKIRKTIGFASQENCIYEELTAEENIAYFGKLHQLTNEQIRLNTDTLLNLVELHEARNVLAKNMSGGMKRRLDLACALVHNPQVLIMDEPTTGLDPVLRKHMWNLIKVINQAGTTIIISSHLLEDIEHMCTRIGIISRGRLLVAGTPNQLKDLYSSNEEIHLQTYPGRYNEIISWLNAEKAEVTRYVNKEHKLVLYTPRAEVLLHKILHILEKMDEKLLDVDVNKPKLNEVFEAFMNYDKNDKKQ